MWEATYFVTQLFLRRKHLVNYLSDSNWPIKHYWIGSPVALCMAANASNEYSVERLRFPQIDPHKRATVAHLTAIKFRHIQHTRILQSSSSVEHCSTFDNTFVQLWKVQQEGDQHADILAISWWLGKLHALAHACPITDMINSQLGSGRTYTRRMTCMYWW